MQTEFCRNINDFKIISEISLKRLPGSKADIYIINTCSVTDTADRKCRQAIKKFINQSPDAFIAVVGCYAQLNPEKFHQFRVDLVLGTNEKFNLAEYLKTRRKEITRDPFMRSMTSLTILSFLVLSETEHDLFSKCRTDVITDVLTAQFPLPEEVAGTRTSCL